MVLGSFKLVLVDPSLVDSRLVTGTVHGHGQQLLFNAEGRSILEFTLGGALCAARGLKEEDASEQEHCAPEAIGRDPCI